MFDIKVVLNSLHCCIVDQIKVIYYKPLMPKLTIKSDTCMINSYNGYKLLQEAGGFLQPTYTNAYASVVNLACRSLNKDHKDHATMWLLEK